MHIPDSSDENADDSWIDHQALIRELVAKGVEYLARREHSAHELRQKFQRMGDREAGEEAVQYLIDQGAQCDKRFAEMLCRSRFNAGKGPVKLLHELNEHRIADYIIEQSMSEYDDRWFDLAKEVRVRKFGEDPPATFKDWAKQARFLQQRGFNSSHIGHFDND